MGYHESWLQEADANATTLYATDGYSGSDTDVTTEQYTAAIDLTEKTGVSFDVTFDGDNSTDDLIISIYKRITNSTFDNDEIARAAITVSSDGSEDIFSFELLAEDMGPGYYRLGLKRSGSSTTFDVQIIMKYHRMTRSKA